MFNFSVLNFRYLYLGKSNTLNIIVSESLNDKHKGVGERMKTDLSK